MEDKIIAYKEQLKHIGIIMDLDGLLEILGGNIELVKKFVQNFHDDFKSIDKDIKDYILLEEYEEAKKLVHKVKGASANLRFTQIYMMSCSLEEVLKMEENVIIFKNFECFSDSMRKILQLADINGK